jgi:hypothetical protein
MGLRNTSLIRGGRDGAPNDAIIAMPSVDRGLVRWLDDGALCWQASLNHVLGAMVMFAESSESNRDAECCHRIGSVHCLQVDVRLRGVA